MTSTSRVSLTFLVTLALLAAFAAAQCSSPCNPVSPCQTGFCDGSTCQFEIKDPRPAGCCTKDSHCNANEQLCLLGECNTLSNQCEFREICSASQYQGASQYQESCFNDRQCAASDTPCSQSKCINEVCVISPIPSNDPSCCNQVEDCPSQPCTTKFCDVERHSCFYRRQAGCTYTDATDSLPTALFDSSPPPSSPSGDIEEAEPGIGDIIGAIIGFIILGILVCAFIVVVIMMIIQKAVRQLRGE